jgi:hypothetical protein
MIRKLACAGLLTVALRCLPAPAGALSLTNLSVADATLMEMAPNNSNGGQTFVAAGRTQNGARVRALYRFDLSNLPTNALVTSAVLQLDCTRVSSEPACLASLAFGLHRMLRPWGEGTNVGVVNPGQGWPANPGDATWLHAFFPTNAWSVPGGQAGVDYSAVESSFQFVTTAEASPYRFESTPELVEDVQLWVREPALNFGWLLLGNPEDIICTARRFNSREDPNSQPLLEINFILPAVIEAVRRVGNEMEFSFLALPGQHYRVDHRDHLGPGDWQTLTNVGYFTATNRVQLRDPITAAPRFYRVATY